MCRIWPIPSSRASGSEAEGSEHDDLRGSHRDRMFDAPGHSSPLEDPGNNADRRSDEPRHTGHEPPPPLLLRGQLTDNQDTDGCAKERGSDQEGPERIQFSAPWTGRLPFATHA